MAKPLTLQSALYFMARMWAGMARTGQAKKPRLGINGDCFLCEYCCRGNKPENREENGWCSKCRKIMKEIWPHGCQGSGSIYDKWRNAKSKQERQKHARKIADETWVQWNKERGKTK